MLTKKEVMALGWAYGKLNNILGKNYDLSGVKFNNACMHPISSVTMAHMAAIQKKLLTKKLVDDLAVALDCVDINNMEYVTEPVLTPQMQGVFQIAYIHGRNGDNFEKCD